MNRKGFSLIELLVVIAIIAILSAILFPVFARAREGVRQTQCMTQMHEMDVALQLFYHDNNKYPAALFGFAEVSGGAFYLGGASAAQNVDKLRYKPLFNKQKYMNDNTKFLCPDTKDKTAGPLTAANTPTLTTTAVYPSCTPLAGNTYTFTSLIRHDIGRDGDASYPLPASNQPVYFYKYSNYDVQPKPNATLDGPATGGVYEVHYALDWTGATDQKADYAINPNQMKYGTLTDESHTVVTWCSLHAMNAGSDKVLVLTLGGQTKAVDKKTFYNKGPLGILR